MLGYVYRIIAPNSKCVYVGQSVNPKKRFRAHKWESAKGRHNNPALQNFLQKHADAEMYFWPTEDMCAEEKADEALCREMGLTLLNIAACGEPSPTLGRKASAETRAKLSAARKGNQYARGTTHTVSAEGRARMSAAQMGHQRNLGRVLSPETRKKISESHKGLKHSVETCEKIRKLRTGVKTRPHTIETRAKMSMAALGNQNARKIPARHAAD